MPLLKRPLKQFVQVRDVMTGAIVKSLQYPTPVGRTCFSPDSSLLALTTSQGKGPSVVTWDFVRQEQKTLGAHPKGIRALAFHPHQPWVASAGFDGRVRIWDCRTGGEVMAPLVHPSDVRKILFSPDGQSLACFSFADGKGTLHLWDLSTGKARAVADPEGLFMSAWAFSPDSQFLVANLSHDVSTPAFWRVSDGKKLRQLVGHAESVRALAFHPDGTRLVSASNDGTVKLWDPKNGRELLTLSGHTQPVAGVAFSKDGSRLISWSDREIKIWNGAAR